MSNRKPKFESRLDEIVQRTYPSGDGCHHPFRHTVYGAEDPADNGTSCAICGEKL